MKASAGIVHKSFLPSSLGVNTLDIFISLSITLTITLQVFSPIVRGKKAMPAVSGLPVNLKDKVPPLLFNSIESAFKVKPLTTDEAISIGYDFLLFPPW